MAIGFSTRIILVQTDCREQKKQERQNEVWKRKKVDL